MKRTIVIEGMMCSHCTGRVKKVLEALQGVQEAEMSLEQKTAQVECSGNVSDEELKKAVIDAGYEVKEIY
ncbi:MAG: heavy-metal-associated domain-containing protein [Lachnospiraceae bacterium]|nr:heavy-metal-associated domain-containing protein [Lachnospiraceae bacterium]